MPTVMVSWWGSIPATGDVIMVVSCWLLPLPVGRGTAGALRQIRVEYDRLPSRQERTCRSHARHDTSDTRHTATSLWSHRRAQEPDRNPLAESVGGLTMTLGFLV